MRRSTFSGFDWDDGDIGKCQKHGVAIEEIEALLLSEPAVYPDALHSDERSAGRQLAEQRRAGQFLSFSLSAKAKMVIG